LAGSENDDERSALSLDAKIHQKGTGQRKLKPAIPGAAEYGASARSIIRIRTVFFQLPTLYSTDRETLTDEADRRAIVDVSPTSIEKVV